jgi:hypothetical protein
MSGETQRRRGRFGWPTCSVAPVPIILVWCPLRWKQRRSRRTISSPHPCATYGVARPAQTLDSTALGRRSLIRMRPLVQVQPGPQIGPDQRKRLSVPSFHGGRSISPVRTAILERIPALLSETIPGRRPARGARCGVCGGRMTGCRGGASSATVVWWAAGARSQLARTDSRHTAQ